MRTRMAAAAALVVALVACSTSASTTQEQGAVADCASGPVIDLTRVAKVRTVTDLVVLEVDADGNRTERQAPGYPQEIVPTASTGSAVSLQLLAEAMAEKAGDARVEPGPPSVNSSALEEDLGPGTYLMYAGATQLDTSFRATCVGTDRSTADGAFHSWGGPTAGILACAGPRPPDGSFGSMVVGRCPAEGGESVDEDAQRLR